MVQVSLLRRTKIWLLALILVVPLFSTLAYAAAKPVGATGERILVG